MLSTGLSAQFQVGLKGGYALGAAQSPIGVSVDGDQTTSIYGTNGQGIPFGVEFRYLFGDHFGLQLDATYLLGSELTNFEVLDAGWEQSTVTKTSQFRIAPTLVFKTDLGIYSRFGVLIPLAGQTVATTKNANGGGLAIPSQVDVTINGKFGLGFVGALGYELTLGNIGIFGELEYIGLAVKRASTEITKYEFGGVDQIDNLTDEQKNTSYEDVTTSTGMMAQGTSSAFNSIGLNIGVRFNIGSN